MSRFHANAKVFSEKNAHGESSGYEDCVLSWPVLFLHAT
jgi:hypothetical protein